MRAWGGRVFMSFQMQIKRMVQWEGGMGSLKAFQRKRERRIKRNLGTYTSCPKNDTWRSGSNVDWNPWNSSSNKKAFLQIPTAFRVTLPRGPMPALHVYEGRSGCSPYLALFSCAGGEGGRLGVQCLLMLADVMGSWSGWNSTPIHFVKQLRSWAEEKERFFTGLWRCYSSGLIFNTWGSPTN